jgi:hypothetical protein
MEGYFFFSRTIAAVVVVFGGKYFECAYMRWENMLE